MKATSGYLKIYLLLLIFLSLPPAADVRAKNSEIQQLIENAYGKSECSGVILAAKNDQIIFSGAVGRANRKRLSALSRIKACHTKF